MLCFRLLQAGLEEALYYCRIFCGTRHDLLAWNNIMVVSSPVCQASWARQEYVEKFGESLENRYNCVVHVATGS